jgi:DNA-binding transcriptional regulator LsrR (DeoR family)
VSLPLSPEGHKTSDAAQRHSMQLQKLRLLNSVKCKTPTKVNNTCEQQLERKYRLPTLKVVSSCSQMMKEVTTSTKR